MTVDLDALPPPDVVEPLDFESILSDMAADYRARWPDFSAWLESEPALKLLETAAYRELLLRARVNDAARACMLPHAAGGDLDNLAALFGVQRRAGETDAALRRRTTLSLGAHNTAGSIAGYEYWALRVPGVEHVCVSSPAAGQVSVVAVGAVEGEGAEALDAQVDSATVVALAAALSADEVRPIADQVGCYGVAVRAYRVAAAVTTVEGARDREAVRAASEASLRRYCLERHRCAPIGNDIRRGALFAALHVPGVESVALTAPADDVAMPDSQAGWPTAAVPVGTVYGGGASVAEPVRHPMTGITVTLA